MTCVPFREQITIIRRTYTYTDYEPSVSLDSQITMSANVQHPSPEQVESMLEGERIDEKPIDIRIPQDEATPKIADHQDDDVSDVIQWRSEYYELKQRRLHTKIIPHWYCIGVRIDPTRTDGLP